MAVLWKHYDMYSQKNQSRRGRELVVFFIATIGNYDYAISWIFHQEGTLEVDAALTGIMLPKGVKDAKVAGHDGMFGSGHLVSANVEAPHHQHFFNFRLDMDVDGPNNSVHEMNTHAAPPGKDNPSLNVMVMDESELASEKRAASMDMQAARHWLVESVGAERARAPDQLHPRARSQCAAVRRAQLAGARARRLHQQSFLGHAVSRRRDECGGAVSQPERRWRRLA